MLFIFRKTFALNAVSNGSFFPKEKLWLTLLVTSLVVSRIAS